jgi:dienelactone hydrolase
MKKLWLFGCSLAVFFLALSLPAAEKSFPPNASPQEFAAWQARTRAFLADVLYNGPPPEAVSLAPEFGKEETRENYKLQEVKFHDRPGHVTTGWLARPLQPAVEKLPAVLALHGHDFRAHETFDPKNMYYYGDLLASKGYIVLALNLEHEDLTDIHPKLIHAQWPLPRHFQFPPMGQRVWMVKRGIDLVQTLPDADAEKIGVVGLSNGGITAMFVGAMDPRVKLTVASGNLIMHHRMWHTTLIHCRCQYLARIDGVLDYYDVAALVAPRPLIIQSGERDPIFPIKSARQAFAFIQQAYALAGAPDKVIHDVHPGAHVFVAETPLAWFDQYLPLPGSN